MRACNSTILSNQELAALSVYTDFDPALLAPAWLQASIRSDSGQYLDEINAERLQRQVNATLETACVPNSALKTPMT